jgi:hypothetical protein
MGIRDKANEVKHKAGRLLSNAGKLDRNLQNYVDVFIQRGLSVEPIDVRKDILRQVAERIATISPGKRRFPFKHLTVELFAADEESQAVLEEAFITGNRLEQDVQEFLHRETGAAPVGLRIKVRVVVQPPPEDATGIFSIVFRREAAPGGDEPAGAKAQLVIIRGKAARKRYTLDKDRIYIGRVPQAVDDAKRIIRRNDIVFEDSGDKINGTVSRIHAQIRYNQETNEYRISDDLSAHGTRVLRDGKTHEVPQRRGLKLRAGDEIYFGEACARFELSDPLVTKHLSEVE